MGRDRIVRSRSGGGERGEKKGWKRDEEKDRLGASVFLSVSSFSSFSLCPCVLPPEFSLTDVPDPAGDKDARHGWLELGEKEEEEEEEEEEERNGNNADGRKKEEEIEIMSKLIALFTLLQTKKGHQQHRSPSDTRSPLAFALFGLASSTPARSSWSPDTSRSNRSTFSTPENGVQRRHRGRRRRRRGHGRARRHVPAHDGKMESVFTHFDL